MSDNNTNWLDKIPLDAISIAVMVSSMFLDGAYLRRFAYGSWFGLLCAYTLNCVADLAVNKLTREFVRHRMGRLGKAKSVLVWVLLAFAFASFYFTVVFSWREASLKMPNEPRWLRGSMATFAPTILAGLGAAEALKAKKSEAKKHSETTPEPIPESVPVPEPQPESQPEPVQPEALDFDPSWPEATRADAKGIWATANGEREGTAAERLAYLRGELHKKELRMPEVAKSTLYRWADPKEG